MSSRLASLNQMEEEDTLLCTTSRRLPRSNGRENSLHCLLILRRTHEYYAKSCLMAVVDTILILLVESETPQKLSNMDLCYVQGPDLSLKLLDSFGFVHEVFRLLVQFCQMLGLILRFSCLTGRVTYLIIRFGNS